MASVTVLTFKNRVAAIPTSENTSRIYYDPGTSTLRIISGYTRGSRGEHMFTIVREVDLNDLTLDL